MTYHVEWIPTDKLIALAKKQGMPEGEDCVCDYAEPEQAAQHGEVEDFDEAVRLAKEKLEGDYFGQTMIERLVFISSRYGDRYTADAVWHVSHDSQPNKEQPDYTPEIDLVLDERIVA